jgi:SulP family sulfate permease
MVMASLLFVQRMSHAQMAAAKLIASPADVEGIPPEHAAILEAAGGRILIFQMDGPLSFGAAKDISHLLLSSRLHDVLIIDFIDVPFIDSSASLALEEVIAEMQSAGDTVIVCSMRDSVHKTLEQIGLFKVLQPDHVAADRLGALRVAEAHLHG